MSGVGLNSLVLADLALRHGVEGNQDFYSTVYTKRNKNNSEFAYEYRRDVASINEILTVSFPKSNNKRPDVSDFIPSSITLILDIDLSKAGHKDVNSLTVTVDS